MRQLHTQILAIIIMVSTVISVQGQNCNIRIEASIRNECYGSSDGRIDLLITGGLDPYQIHWEDNNGQKFRTNLKAGDYKVKITDSNGCVKSGFYTVKGISMTSLTWEKTENGFEVTSPNKHSEKYYWFSKGDGFNETGRRISYSGSYDLKLVVRNSEGCVQSTEIDVNQ